MRNKLIQKQSPPHHVLQNLRDVKIYNNDNKIILGKSAVHFRGWRRRGEVISLWKCYLNII